MACARAAGGAERLHLIHSPDNDQGLAASLRAGLAAVRQDAEGVFVFLGDMPDVPIGIAAQLAQAFANGALAVAAVFGGVRGQPVLLARAVLPRLGALAGDRGAGAVLDGLGARLALVEAAHDGVLFDVDLTTDLDRAEARSPPLKIPLRQRPASATNRG